MLGYLLLIEISYVGNMRRLPAMHFVQTSRFDCLISPSIRQDTV